MDELLVALDVDTIDQARALADELRGAVGRFKIGSRLFTSHGPALSRRSRPCRSGFLDLKFHDIRTRWPARWRRHRILACGWSTCMHRGPYDAAGGAQAADTEASRLSARPPLVIAVTMLTSMSESTLSEIGMSGPMTAQVEHGPVAQSAGLDGVVVSGNVVDSRLLRAAVHHRDARHSRGSRQQGRSNPDVDGRQALSAGAAISSSGARSSAPPAVAPPKISRPVPGHNAT
jgi:orotidine-5'-phosphate decarboxylase